MERALTPGMTEVYNNPEIPMNCSEFGRQILEFLLALPAFREQVVNCP